MRVGGSALLVAVMAAILTVAGSAWFPAEAGAATITFSGTVSYTGSYTGDSLYVGVLDTTGVEEVNVLTLQVFDPGAPPFNQSFSLSFDNTGVGSNLLVVALFDRDGDGTNSVSGADIFGWYNGSSMPAAVSSSSSHSGLDFALPLAEVHGNLTFASGQTEARVELSTAANCLMDSFRPSDPFLSPGAYAIIGVYPGTYCIHSEGGGTNGYAFLCYGDATCASPTLVTIGATDIKNNIDFDFAAVVPVVKTTWGLLKSRY
jgi:hypothetical protein